MKNNLGIIKKATNMDINENRYSSILYLCNFILQK